MFNLFEIGLNLETALLINVLIIAAAGAVTMQVRSTASGVCKFMLCAVSLTLLTLVVFALPHEPLFSN
jgi:hypothetical protein